MAKKSSKTPVWLRRLNRFQTLFQLPRDNRHICTAVGRCSVGPKITNRLPGGWVREGRDGILGIPPRNSSYDFWQCSAVRVTPGR
jgi:hypothetical protein